MHRFLGLWFLVQGCLPKEWLRMCSDSRQSNVFSERLICAADLEDGSGRAATQT